MGVGGKIFYKHVDDLSSHDMRVRTAAEQARREWLKDRVAWRKEGRVLPPAPTGITYEDAKDAAQRGGNVDFEGRKARVVSLNAMDEMGELHSARLELDLVDEYLVLFGHFSGSEFMETGRERPFSEG
jgi:hypothetical protein